MICQDRCTGCPGEDRPEKSLRSMPLAFGQLPEHNTESLKAQVKIPSAFQYHCLGRDHLEGCAVFQGRAVEA